MFSQQASTDHRNGDDLLTGGLGLDGLRAMLPPAFADAEHPTPAELRRRALWSNWRGIADVSAGGGYGELYGSVANVPGREFSAFAQLPGASQPHRVLLQLPDAFDPAKPCLVVTASSGSRGIYGAISMRARASPPMAASHRPMPRSRSSRRRWAGRAWPTSMRIRRTIRKPTGAGT